MTKLELNYGNKYKKNDFITKALPIPLCNRIDKMFADVNAPFYAKVKAFVDYYEKNPNAKY